MKAEIHFLCINLLALLSLLNYQTATCNAGELTYSWTGQLRLYDDTSPDPWMIGEDDAEFQLETSVSTNAVDQNDTQEPFAAFSAISAQLWVDGQEALYLGDAYIDFADTTDILDLLTAGGLFSMFGQPIEISSVVGLEASAFSLNLVSETPPYFDPTVTTSNGGTGRQPYMTIVNIGTFVTVVPEPSSLLIAGTGIFAFAGIRRK